MYKKQAPAQKHKKVRPTQPNPRTAAKSAVESPGLLALQAQIGNGAVQRLLVQRGSNLVQRDDGEETAPEALDTGNANLGTVTINTVTYETFAVSGLSLEAVHKELQKRKEWGECSCHFDATTDNNPGSKASQVNITLDITIRLPEWDGLELASSSEQREWNRMMTALRAHEEQHAEIGRKWAPLFQTRLLGKLKSKIAAEHKKILADFMKEVKQYDADTKHGQTEGVTLTW